MSSLRGAEVAREVLRNIGNNRRPQITKIAIAKGYTPETARTGIPQRTKSYKAVMSLAVSKMEEERNRILDAMSARNLTKVQYNHLVDAMDKTTKNIQLLSGRSTENIAVKPIYGGNSLENKSS
jgi:hypothetical protein